jgi:hypothetical protein
MAQVFVGGDEYFNALTSGNPHQGTINFIQGQFNNPSSNLSETSRRFQEQARVSIEASLNSTAMRLATAATRKLRSLWNENSIQVLTDVGDFQYAPLVMQRYIMAHPTTRRLYQQERCDGYSDTYVDIHIGDVGEDHYDYRRVMDGVVVFSDEEDENGDLDWSSTTYLDELDEDDEELEFESQLDIIQSWETMDEHYKSGKTDDLTSKYNAELE